MTGVHILNDKEYAAFVTMSPCEQCGTMAQEGDKTPWIVGGAKDGKLTFVAKLAALRLGISLKIRTFVDRDTPEHVWSDEHDGCICTECYGN